MPNARGVEQRSKKRIAAVLILWFFTNAQFCAAHAQAVTLSSKNSQDGVMQVDSRLIGHWLSDAKRTAYLRRYELGQEDETLEKFNDTYGKVHKVYTATTVTAWRTDTPNTKRTNTYKVIASDDLSIVIESETADGKPRLTHIYFDGSGHFMLNGERVEFYMRVQNATKQ